MDHDSSPNGCHPECAACAKQREIADSLREAREALQNNRRMDAEEIVRATLADDDEVEVLQNCESFDMLETSLSEILNGEDGDAMESLKFVIRELDGDEMRTLPHQNDRDERIRDIFRSFDLTRGHFLNTFAEAVWRADSENFEIIRGAALKLIKKYELQKDYCSQTQKPEMRLE